jgi:hypothetical protein
MKEKKLFKKTLDGKKQNKKTKKNKKNQPNNNIFLLKPENGCVGQVLDDAARHPGSRQSHE